MRSTILFLCALFMFLQYKLWFDEGNVTEVKRLSEELALNKLELEEQLMQNERLVKVVKSVKHSPHVVESYARKELGMKKKDEDYYQVITE